MQKILRAASALVIASMLGACSGGGTGTSAVPNGTNFTPASNDFVAMGSFTARGDAAESIHFFPSNDGLWRSSAEGGAMRGQASGSNLINHGGPVQTSPKTYVVYWGSAWNGSGDPDGMQARLNSFLGHVGGTSWNSTVTQYGSGNPSSMFGGSYVDTSSTPPRRPKQSQMAAEAAKAAAHFGDTSVNAQYIVAMPHGVSPSGFKTQYCAYHSTTSASGHSISWTNLPYLPDAGSGCGAGSVTGSVLDGVSIVGGHEMAESETDPQLNAWYDSAGAEIGDKCAWVNLQSTSMNGASFPTQPLWSNASSSCVQSYP